MIYEVIITMELMNTSVTSRVYLFFLPMVVETVKFYSHVTQPCQLWSPGYTLDPRTLFVL